MGMEGAVLYIIKGGEEGDGEEGDGVWGKRIKLRIIIKLIYCYLGARS